jgi:hypothetical protein
MVGRDTQGDIGTLQLRTRIPDPAYGVTFYQRMESSEAIAGILMRSSWQPLTERRYPEQRRIIDAGPMPDRKQDRTMC